MIVTSVMDVSRNWSVVLSRFGFGTIVLTVFSKVGLFPSFIEDTEAELNEWSLGILSKIVFWIMLSMIIGAIASMLGSFQPDSRYGELAKAKRAFRVGQMGNPLLAEFLRDAQGKYELASGLIGSLYLIFFGLVVADLSGLAGTPVNSSQISLTLGQYLIIGFFGVLGSITALILKRSVTSSLDAIDAVLRENPHVKEPAL